VRYILFWRVKIILIDLHIHSALSACGEDIMSPHLILEQAERKKLNLISITDHNAITHSLLASKLSEGRLIRVIPGVELTSREEVHLLAYFPDGEALMQMEEVINHYLPKRMNNPQVFGYQIYYNQKGKIIGTDDLLRQTALEISLDHLVEVIHQIGGLAICAHIDKSRFSLLSQLGFIDREANFNALEVSKYRWYKQDYQLGDTWEGFPVISGSDSHSLEDIGLFYLEDRQDRIRDFSTLGNFLKSCRDKGRREQDEGYR